MTDIRTITSETDLDELASSNHHVLVDFWVPSSTNCAVTESEFDKYSREHRLKGRPAFAKVDLSKVRGVGQRFEITEIPTFVVLVDGKRVELPDGLGNPVTSEDEDTTALLGLARSLEESARQTANAMI